MGPSLLASIVLLLCSSACGQASELIADAGQAAADGGPVTGCLTGSAAGSGNETGPSIEAILAPLSGRVLQRIEGEGNALFGLSLSGESDCVEVRLLNESDEPGPWARLEYQNHQSPSQVTGVLSKIPIGKHGVEVRASLRGVPGASSSLDSIWVGDVFIAAGQSNASFSGERPQASVSGQVAYFNGSEWIACQDPVLEADPQGEGGAAWCLLGDMLHQSDGVPSAFVPLAWGGSSLHQWQENSATSPLAPGYLYQRMVDIVSYLGPGGAKAVLWHQGESELTEGTSVEAHRDMLLALINGTRGDYILPWFVSEVSYLIDQETLAPYLCPELTESECTVKIAEEQARVIAGQRAVVDASMLIFRGVATDVFGSDNRHDGSHFDEETLMAVAGLWHQRLAEIFDDVSARQTSLL